MEIASLTEHLLTECEWRADFSQCPLCSEALTRDQPTEHAQSVACNRESLYGCTVFLFHAHPERDKVQGEEALFVTYTIIQSITSSEMCSLHLTHPSAHTPGALGSRHCGARGAVWWFGALLKGLTSVVDNSCRSRDSNPQPRVTSPTFYPLVNNCPTTGGDEDSFINLIH